MKLAEKLGAKVITDWTIDSEFGWPPDCTGLIYQPERPVTDRHLSGDSDSQTTEDLDK